MSWRTIPIEERGDVYSESIKHRDDLWTVPTYEPGEVWQMYGGFGHANYKVVQLFSDTRQLLVREQTTRGELALLKLDHYGYATTGTPSLRIRIS